MKYHITIRESIQNALDFIEAKNGHKGGDLYQELAHALRLLEEGRDLNGTYLVEDEVDLGPALDSIHAQYAEDSKKPD